jgi:hypothetical protein
MNTNKQEAINMLKDLKLHILETNDFPDQEINKIDNIIKFITKNL